MSDLEVLSSRVVSALGNGLYQGFILALVLWLSLNIFRRVNASTRYLAGLVALGLIGALPLLHFFLGATPPKTLQTVSPDGKRAAQQTSAGDEVQPEDVNSAAPSTPFEPAIPVELLAPGQEPLILSAANAEPSGNGALNASPDGSGLPVSPRDDQPEARGLAVPLQWFSGSPITPGQTRATSNGASASDVAVVKLAEAGRRLVVEPRFTGSYWRLPLAPVVCVVLSCLWIGLALMRTGFLIWQYRLLLRLKRASKVGPAAMLTQFARVLADMRVQRRIECRVSCELVSPIAAGFWRPAVVVPDSLTACAPEALEQMFRHELAHLQRRDDWTNLVQQVLAALFFFHPAVWWLSRRLTLDREIACDDHVLAAVTSPRDYALFLTDFASRTRGRAWAAAPAAWSNTTQLKERINMILDTKRNTSPRLAPAGAGALTAATITIAALAWFAAPRLAIAQVASSDNTTSAEVSVELSTAATSESEKSSRTSGDAGPLSSADAKEKDPSQLVPSVIPGGSNRGKREPGRATLRVAPAAPAVATLRRSVARSGATPIAPTSSQVAIVLDLTEPVVEADIAIAPASPLVADAAPVPPAAARKERAEGRGTSSSADVLAEPQKSLRLELRQDRNSELEERLERLEKMVESLVHPNSKAGESKFSPKKVTDREADGLDKLRKEKEFLGKMKSEFDFKFHADRHDELVHSPEMARALDEVAHEVERAAREAERAAVEFERASKQAELRAREFQNQNRNPSLQQLRQGLAQQRRSLQNRIREIESQLAHLHGQLEHMDQQFEHFNEEVEEIEEAEEKQERARDPNPNPKREQKEPARR